MARVHTEFYQHPFVALWAEQDPSSAYDRHMDAEAANNTDQHTAPRVERQAYSTRVVDRWSRSHRPLGLVNDVAEVMEFINGNQIT
jgi:hypothetical protein